MFSPERIVAATARLDPESRALVELSARRGMSDEEIAGVLGVEPAELTRRREQALAQLASELGDRHARRDELRDRLLRVDEETWRAEVEPGAAADSAAAGADAAEVDASAAGAEAGTAEAEPDTAEIGGGRGARESGRQTPAHATAGDATRPRRSLARIAIGLLAAVLAIVLVVLLVRSGDDGGGSAKQSSNTATTRSTTSTTPPAPAPAAPARTMQRLNGTYGHGTAQLRPRGGGAVLRLRATGFLRPQGGGYAVFLVRSSSDARRIYSTGGTTIRGSFTLPSDYRRYRYVEVARAIPNLDSAYSGLVLLRASMSGLAQR